MPRWNDAGGVAPERRHLFEAHPAGVSAQRVPQQVGLVTRRRHEYWFLGRQGFVDEGKHSLKEPVCSAVEKRFVVELAVRTVAAGLCVLGELHIRWRARVPRVPPQLVHAFTASRQATSAHTTGAGRSQAPHR
jgi:hypothetical protein